jgi:hypothetical protein
MMNGLINKQIEKLIFMNWNSKFAVIMDAIMTIICIIYTYYSHYNVYWVSITILSLFFLIYRPIEKIKKRLRSKFVFKKN